MAERGAKDCEHRRADTVLFVFACFEPSLNRTVVTVLNPLSGGAAQPLPSQVLQALPPASTLRAEASSESAVRPPLPSLELVRWAYVRAVLASCDGNVSEAARQLGLHRQSLQRMLRCRKPPR